MWYVTCFAGDDKMNNNMNSANAKQVPLPHIVCTAR